MFKKQLLMVAACGLISGSLIFTGCKNEAKVEASGAKIVAIDSNNMDKSVKPGDDFFLYSNGGWMKSTPIPAEQSRWGTFNILQEETNVNLRELVEEAAKIGGEKGTAKQQIGDFFKSGMDTATINKKGFQPIEEDLNIVKNIASKEDWIEKFNYLNSKTISPLFYLYAGQDDKNSSMVIANLAQGGLGLGNRDYYTEKDAKSEELRGKYVKHIENMFKLIGMENAENAAKGVMEFETKLANISMTNVERRDPFKTYNKIPIADLKKITPVINWDNYFAALNVPVPAEINVTSMPFFQGLTKAINSTDLEALKNYFTWNILNETSSLLSEDFVNERFDFFGKTFSGAQKIDERWKRTLNLVSGQLGDVLGQIYVEKYFPPEAKTRMEELVKNVRIALEGRIKNLDWMGEETKAKALEKLAAISVKVGYPDKWDDFSKIEITPDNYYQNCLNASLFHTKKMLDEIGKPYDKNKWHMSPQTVNAYYSPNSNEIVFPAGILQPPFFYKDGDDAVNYGAIGVVIAHEITHGFDDQGRNFDKNGNLVEWWTKEDAERFTEKTKVLSAQYAKYAYPQLGENVFINPDLTVGENIADLGGVTISYDAFLRTEQGGKAQSTEVAIDNFTPAQRFFLAYSQVWRQNIRDEELSRRLKDDVHSPGDARVNGILPNIPAFYEAFAVKEGDKMYLHETERALIC
jgi:putative endopeptidase